LPGLDRNFVQEINWEQALNNVVADTRSDFILAPHYGAIFSQNATNFIDRTCSDLRNGRYEPRLPITMSVPKGSLLTRPGSILEPTDRLIHQALIEQAIPRMEEQIDRSRSFSHVPSTTPGSLFRHSQACWSAFQGAVAEICDNSAFVIRSDVANYFETIPQHALINLMHGSAVPGEIVNLVEAQLLSFRQQSSFGIIQGIFPSDYLGNFYLIDFDGDCALKNLPSARYVDDIFIGAQSETEAKRVLVSIVSRLRLNGLSLNDRKTSILSSDDVRFEEGEVDALFDAARAEIENELDDIQQGGYGFQGDWINGSEVEIDDDEIQVEAVKRLLDFETEDESQREKIDRFCIPILRAAHDEYALDHAIRSIADRPQLTRLYAAYISRFAPSNADAVTQIENQIQTDNFITDYERMYAMAAILNTEAITRNTTRKAIEWLESASVVPATRALAAIFISKFGSANEKRRVRLRYENETSEFVRSALLYSASYFPSAERRAMKQAWAGHSAVNSLIGETI